MIDKPEFVTTDKQPAAVIRFTIPREEIRKVMGPAMSEVMAVVAAQGIGPAGPMFSHHFRMDPGIFDFEVGVPVTAPVSPTGRVEPSVLPAAKVVRTVYTGPYEGLGEAWGEFDARLKDEGIRTTPELWERYVYGPQFSTDESTYKTELNRPVNL